MIALHAQGRQNDTIWLHSKQEPYKFSRAISEILGQTPPRAQECELGVAKVWGTKQSSAMGTLAEREGVQKHSGGGGGDGDRGPQRDQSCHKAARTGVGVRFGEGEEVCLCILRGDQREAYPQVKGKRGVGSSQEKG